MSVGRHNTLSRSAGGGGGSGEEGLLTIHNKREGRKKVEGVTAARLSTAPSLCQQRRLHQQHLLQQVLCCMYTCDQQTCESTQGDYWTLKTSCESESATSQHSLSLLTAFSHIVLTAFQCMGGGGGGGGGFMDCL